MPNLRGSFVEEQNIFMVFKVLKKRKEEFVTRTTGGPHRLRLYDLALYKKFANPVDILTAPQIAA